MRSLALSIAETVRAATRALEQAQNAEDLGLALSMYGEAVAAAITSAAANLETGRASLVAGALRRAAAKVRAELEESGTLALEVARDGGLPGAACLTRTRGELLALLDECRSGESPE